MSTALPPWRQGDNFRAPPHQALVDKANELASLVAASSGNTTSVYRTPFGTTIVDESQPTLVGRWIVLVSATQEPGHDNGTPNPDPVYRWKYGFKFPRKNNAPAWDGWNVADGASETDLAYNTAEVPNTWDVAVYGNGVERAKLPDGFYLMPATSSPSIGPVFAFPRESVDDGGNPTVEWWFTWPNGVSGECQTPTPTPTP